MSRVPSKLAAEVHTRAQKRCEYCRLPSVATQSVMEVEHIVPRKLANSEVNADEAIHKPS
jgi:hypothetical protein